MKIKIHVVDKRLFIKSLVIILWGIGIILSVNYFPPVENLPLLFLVTLTIIGTTIAACGFGMVLYLLEFNKDEKIK